MYSSGSHVSVTSNDLISGEINCTVLGLIGIYVYGRNGHIIYVVIVEWQNFQNNWLSEILKQNFQK